jgi:hypothetical protein
MIHACLYTICFVFCYTSWHFYAFCGTNLLTRSHSASSQFSVVFVFQKSYTQNILRIGQNKIRTFYFSWHETKSEDETEGGGRGWPHPRAVRPRPVPRHQGVRPPGPPPDAALPPIYSPWWEKPKARSIFLETYYKPPPSSTRDREGPEALLGTLPERGITARGLLHHHGRLRSDMWVVYLGLRVYSSS